MVKLVFIVIFIVFVNLTPQNAWIGFALYLIFLISIFATSQIKFSTVANRTLISIPFLMAAIPLIFSNNGPLISFSIFPNYEIYLSIEGIHKFLSITIKSIISIQAAILLVTTSQTGDLISALERIKFPRLLIAVINLAYRYLFVIREEVIHLLQARTSRSSFILSSKKRGGNFWWRAKVTGSMAGNLFVRSIERSERVHAAMISRGYNGKVITSNYFSKKITRDEYLITIIGIFFVIIIWLFSLFITG